MCNPNSLKIQQHLSEQLGQMHKQNLIKTAADLLVQNHFTSILLDAFVLKLVILLSLLFCQLGSLILLLLQSPELLIQSILEQVWLHLQIVHDHFALRGPRLRWSLAKACKPSSQQRTTQLLDTRIS